MQYDCIKCISVVGLLVVTFVICFTALIAGSKKKEDEPKRQTMEAIISTEVTTISKETLALFSQLNAKNPQITDWSNFSYELCIEGPSTLYQKKEILVYLHKLPDARWNIHDIPTSTHNPLLPDFDRYNGHVDLNNPGGQSSWNLTTSHLGDYKCHDYLNRPECLYDLGDCCEEDILVDEGETCYSCYCYPNITDQVCNGFVEFLADGFCDDENNNVECYFDGGDCCFDVYTYFCNDCHCYYGDLTIAFTSEDETLTTGFPLLFGD